MEVDVVAASNKRQELNVPSSTSSRDRVQTTSRGSTPSSRDLKEVAMMETNRLLDLKDATTTTMAASSNELSLRRDTMHIEEDLTRSADKDTMLMSRMTMSRHPTKTGAKTTTMSSRTHKVGPG